MRMRTLFFYSAWYIQMSHSTISRVPVMFENHAWLHDITAWFSVELIYLYIEIKPLSHSACHITMSIQSVHLFISFATCMNAQLQ